MAVQAMVAVTLDRHESSDIRSFEKDIKTIPGIKACYHLSGRFDYLLHVVAKDLKNSGTWLKSALPRCLISADVKLIWCFPKSKRHKPGRFRTRTDKSKQPQKNQRRWPRQSFNPKQALMEARREFGEHGGVAPSISRSATFTVQHPETMPEIFGGLKGPEKGGCFLYSRHFNPTVDVLSRYLAAMEGTEAAVCPSGCSRTWAWP